MTFEEDRADLARHEQEIEAHKSFNYAIFDRDERNLLGCVYLDPPSTTDHDVVVSWWVVDEMIGTELEASLTRFVPHWIKEVWGFSSPLFSP